VDFNVTGQLLTTYSALAIFLRKDGNTKQCLSYYVYFKKAYDSVTNEVLYNIQIEFGIPMKLVRLIKMCLNDTYSRVQAGKHLSDILPIKNTLKQ
jgi:hypothetical protein